MSLFRTAPVCYCRLGLPLSASAASEATANKFYEDAQRFHAEGDRSAALIQLKNALLENNQDIPSLLLMGDIYLETGEAPAAEIAYGDALLLRADPAYATRKLPRPIWYSVSTRKSWRS